MVFGVGSDARTLKIVADRVSKNLAAEVPCHCVDREDSQHKGDETASITNHGFLILPRSPQLMPFDIHAISIVTIVTPKIKCSQLIQYGG
jgi:hypothetical protein